MNIETDQAAIQIAAADQLLQDGRIEEAVKAYSSALMLQPASPDAWFNLAWAQRADRRFNDALESYSNALAHGIANPPEAYLNRAVIFSEFLFQPERAGVELQAALDHDPNFIPALLNLANIHEDLDEIELAMAGYRKVLALDRANGRANARLGILQVARGDAAKAAVELEAALPSARSVEESADMLFSLGTALDNLGNYQSAFQAFEAANWQARAAAPEAYDPAGQVEIVDRIIHYYPTAHSGTPQDQIDLRHIFICGMFRSGSTLVERILGRHSAITPAGELDHIPAMARKLRPYPEAAASLSEEQIAALRQDYLNGLPNGQFITDKRCDNFLHIGLIKTLFPRARIIHTRRHPLDNLLSVYFLHFGHEISYSHTLPEAAHFYIQYRRMMEHWHKIYGAEIYDLDYDELVAKPQDTVKRLLAFLDLPFEEGCLTPAQAPGAVRTPSAWQARQPLHTRSSGRWHNYEGQLDAARHMIAAAGYSV